MRLLRSIRSFPFPEHGPYMDDRMTITNCECALKTAHFFHYPSLGVGCVVNTMKRGSAISIRSAEMLNAESSEFNADLVTSYYSYMLCMQIFLVIFLFPLPGSVTSIRIREFATRQFISTSRFD